MALTRVTGATVRLEAGRFSSKGTLFLILGPRRQIQVGRYAKSDFDYALSYQLERPWHMCTYQGRQYWMFGNGIFADDENLTADAVAALLTERYQRRTRQVQRAQQVAVQGTPQQPRRREYIPADVKNYVFQRDGGRCVECGSSNHLEFDHIIPVSRGGSSSERNLQLLCQDCNRRKRDSL